MGAIEIRNLSYSYHDNATVYRALDDINLSIEQGEFVCLIGHSGCGKSTLLYQIAGLTQPDSGQVLVDGVPVTGPSTSRSMVFQRYSLFPWLTAAKNVGFCIRNAKPDLSKAEVAERVKRYLERVGMLDAADSYPFQLSGGMQQRVAIASALAMESDTLLLDEPFGALDAKNRASLQRLLVGLWRDSEPRRTVVFVTHDLDEALLLADRIVFMRPAHIERDIRVPFERPRDFDQLVATPEFRQLRNELLALFYLDEEHVDRGLDAARRAAHE